MDAALANSAFVVGGWPDETGAGPRTAAWAWCACAQWAEPGTHRSWLAALHRALAPHAVRGADPARARRLAAVRRAWDPDGTFAGSNPFAPAD